MNASKLDHLVVAAAELAAGCEYIEDLLGVCTEKGGRHDAMGTHNRLLRLGEDQYLEVIAVDPEAPAPDRPRWFALDAPEMQAHLREGPALVTWVARTDDIERAATRPPYDGMELRDMSRGDLQWRMTFTANGGLLHDGMLPLLIEWRSEPTPPRRLPDTGCALSRFLIQGPHDRRLRHVLEDLDIEGVTVDQSVQPGLAAVLSTPARGEVVLSSVAAATS